MGPLPSPNTPPSPISPTFSHPLESSASTGKAPPRLQVVTTFPFRALLRQPTMSSAASPIGVDFPPAVRHKRHTSSVSSIAFSPATEAIFSQPLTSLPTPLPPQTSVHPDMQRLASPRREDGRQSRMSIRSPMPPNIHSPILERIISLPLRVSNHSTPSAQATNFTDAERSGASNSEQADDELYETWRPWTPVHTRVPALPFPPTRSQSRPYSRPTSGSSIRRGSSSRSSSSIKKRARSPPPKYHVTVVPSLASTLAAQQSTFDWVNYNNALSQLRTPLVPLISVTTGLPHPQFPRSLLQYHLLTHDQLDSLARWYHQTEPPSEESWKYPAWIPPYARRATWQATSAQNDMMDVSLITKRRRWGRFIGLRGCETPEGLDAEEQESLVERMEGSGGGL